MIAREYQNQKKYERVPKLKRMPRSITIKMTAREYSKIVLSGIIIIKTTAMEQLTKIIIAVESNTTREYHNQKDCSGVLQTKVLPGSVKTKGLPENITDIFKVLAESTTIKVSQGSSTIQSTARKFHKQKYFQ